MLGAILVAAGMICPIAGAGDAEPAAHHWIFDKDHVRGAAVKAVNGPGGRILGGAQLAKEKGPGSLVLDGKIAHAAMVT